MPWMCWATKLMPSWVELVATLWPRDWCSCRQGALRSCMHFHLHPPFTSATSEDMLRLSTRRAGAALPHQPKMRRQGAALSLSTFQQEGHPSRPPYPNGRGAE
jgi:hypothetical protein